MTGLTRFTRIGVAAVILAAGFGAAFGGVDAVLADPSLGNPHDSVLTLFRGSFVIGGGLAAWSAVRICTGRRDALGWWTAAVGLIAASGLLVLGVSPELAEGRRGSSLIGLLQATGLLLALLTGLVAAVSRHSSARD